MRTFIVGTPWIVAAIISLAACGRSPTEQTVPYVTITPDQSVYTAGSVATITVRNVTDGTVGYNLCEQLLERRMPGTWTVVEHSPSGDAACTDNLLSLPADEAVTVQVQLPAELPEGTYRVEFPGIAGSLDGTSPINRASDPFVVQRAAGLVPTD